MRAVREAGTVREAGAGQSATGVCSDPARYPENLDAPSEDEPGPGSGVTVIPAFL